MKQNNSYKRWLVQLGAFFTLLLIATTSLMMLTDKSSSSKKIVNEPIWQDSKSAEGVSRWQSETEVLQRRLPQLLIIGAKKCGTQALGDMLSMHPLIVRAPSEKHFFEDDAHNYERGHDWYQSQMPPTQQGQITVEISPRYFSSPEVPARVHEMNATIKLLLIVRDPVTRIISDYGHVQQRNRKWKLKLLENFTDEIFTPDGNVDDSNFIVGTSFYGIHMTSWLKVFKREQILILDGDKLLLDPLSEVIKVESFLGVPSYISSSNFYYSRSKGFFCMKTPGRSWCMDYSKGRAHHIKVDQEVIRKLRKYFHPFNQKFYQMVGQEFDWPPI